MAPPFHIKDKHDYIILNRETAKLLRAKQDSEHTVIVDNPENHGDSDEGFHLILQPRHQLTFAIQMLAGPTYLGASLGGIVTYDTTLNQPGENEKWRVRHIRQSAHSTFIKIENVEHGIYLDVINHNEVVCTNAHDGQSQQWKLIPHHHGSMRSADVKAMGITEQQKLKEEKMEERRANEQAAQSSTYPNYSGVNYSGGSPIATNNFCGNPTCGVDHICTADYNRIVRPMGYPGVPGF